MKLHTLKDLISNSKKIAKDAEAKADRLTSSLIRDHCPRNIDDIIECQNHSGKKMRINRILIAIRANGITPNGWFYIGRLLNKDGSDNRNFTQGTSIEQFKRK